MTQIVLDVLNHAGIFIFALTGALAAARLGLDVIGFVVLALIAGLAGGVTRDVLLGVHPPAAFESWSYLATGVAAALVVFVRAGGVERREQALLVLDAIGLSLFCVPARPSARKMGWAFCRRRCSD